MLSITPALYILGKMQYFLIFLAQFLFLLLLSKALTITLSQFLFFLTKSRSQTTAIIALLFFPGVVIHELAHMITAGIFFVPVGDIDLMPKISDDGQLRLGSVMIGKTDVLRRAVIGLAPVMVGLVIILGVPFLLKNQTTFLYPALVGYLLFEVGNTMFSSKKDLEGTIELVAVILILLLTFYAANFRLPFEIFSSFINSEGSVAFFRQINNFMLWTLGIDFSLFLLLKIGVSFSSRR